jgi:hypothetical protein
MRKIFVAAVIGVMLGVLVTLLAERAWPRTPKVDDSAGLVEAGEFV